jgi:hypothetical protein
MIASCNSHKNIMYDQDDGVFYFFGMGLNYLLTSDQMGDGDNIFVYNQEQLDYFNETFVR